MALAGRGLLAIWNGIAPGQEAEFLAWHVAEHMPERVGLPGFLSGRRYTAIDGTPAYFNFYEVQTPAVLRGPEYLARLDAPTEWTRRVVAHFTDTARTICRLVASAGCGTGGLAEVLRFADAPEDAAAAALVARLAATEGVVAAHAALAEGGAAPATAELRLRGKADAEWPAVLIVETASRAAAAALRAGPLAAEALRAAGWPEPAGRGLYGLDYALDRSDLGDGSEFQEGER
jgi:hypothetical protein